MVTVMSSLYNLLHAIIILNGWIPFRMVRSGHGSSGSGDNDLKGKYQVNRKIVD